MHHFPSSRPTVEISSSPLPLNTAMEHAWRSLSGGKRIRAHANPLSDMDFEEPLNPDHVNVPSFYPNFLLPGEEKYPEIKIADVGCGFAGLLVTLSKIFPETLCLGLEIRSRVVEECQDRILTLRENFRVQAQEEEERDAKRQKTEVQDEGKERSESKEVTAADQRQPFSNIWVVCSNAMRAMPNYFRKGQLEKLFFTFPDPHYKRAKHRRRIINQSFLAQYTYILKPGGLLYTITDVEDLHLWMAGHCDRHPLLQRLTFEEWKDDPCVEAMATGTEEGQRVTKNRGKKFVAVYRRI